MGHGVGVWARILEWVAISSSTGIFLTQGSNLCLLHLLAGGFFTVEPSGKPAIGLFNFSHPCVRGHLAVHCISGVTNDLREITDHLLLIL